MEPLKTSHFIIQASLHQLYHKNESRYQGAVSYVYIVLALNFYFRKPPFTIFNFQENTYIKYF